MDKDRAEEGVEGGAGGGCNSEPKDGRTLVHWVGVI